MLKNVIVLVADEAYIPHVKSVMVNCVKQGEWTGDFCLVLPPDVDTEYFESRGIYVLTDPEPTYYRKFAIFDQYFNQEYMTKWYTPQYKWGRVLYLDADVLVQAPLEPLIHEGCWGGILADRELFTLEHAFTHWTKSDDSDPAKVAELSDWLRDTFDITRHQYNTGILLYNPRTITPYARDRLRIMRKSIAPINTHVGKGTDQPIINLVFYNQFNRVRSDMFCYWRSAWDKTIIIHYCSGYAPWIKKTEEMSAYFNDKLGRPCHDIYLENLDNFEKVFPVK